MALSAIVLSSLALAAPTAASPAVSQVQIWELAVSLSAGVVYRMDSMPANLHQPGNEFLQHGLELAKTLSVPLPDDPVLKGAEVDTMAAMGYLVGAGSHPTAKFLEKQGGRAAAALFEFGMLSHLAMTSVVPASETAKGLADQIETAAKDSGITPSTWNPFVDALRNGKTRDAAKNAMPDMLKVVARACAK